MDDVRPIGRNRRFERNLYLSVAHDLKTWTPDLTGLSKPFAAVCALDAAAEEDTTLEALATRLMAAGCRYVCAWGPDCERVHDIVDRTWLREHPEGAADMPDMPEEWWDDHIVLTTWHDDEPLDEALWYAVFNTYLPMHDTTDVLAVAAPQYASHVEHRFADSAQLNDDVVN